MRWEHTLAVAGISAAVSWVIASVNAEIHSRNEILTRCEHDGGTYLVNDATNRFVKNQSIDCSRYSDGHYCRIKNASGDEKPVRGQRLTVMGLVTPNAGSGSYPAARITVDYMLYQTGPHTYKKVVNFFGRPLGLKGYVDSALDIDGENYVNCYTV